jgi:hypothetical protein
MMVKLSAGSLWIETFEGSRPRLRRTRQAMGIQSSGTARAWLFAFRSRLEESLGADLEIGKVRRNSW